MENVYLACAALGGTLWVCPFLMMMFGGHGDASDDGGAGGHDGGLGGHDGGGGGHDDASGGHGDASSHGAADDAHDAAHGTGHVTTHTVAHAPAGGAHEGAIAFLVGFLTFRSIVAAITFFGLGGLAATYGKLGTTRAPVVAIGAGFAALIIVAGVMKLLGKLQDEGTIQIANAVGKVGTVYLCVPAAGGGQGKVTLKLQNRTIECLAVSSAGAIPTGAPCVVVAVVGPNTVEVIPART